MQLARSRRDLEPEVQHWPSFAFYRRPFHALPLGTAMAGRHTDIILRWLQPVAITHACAELAQAATDHEIEVVYYSFAVKESGPWIQRPSVEEILVEEPNITTGGGVMRNLAGEQWATYVVENLCEPALPAHTFQIRVRRWCNLAPWSLEDSEAASARDLLSFTRKAAEASTADVVYGLDVRRHKSCFQHPDPRESSVLFWFARGGLTKVPSFSFFGCAPSLFSNDFRSLYAFTDSKGNVLTEDLLAADDFELLTRHCREAWHAE